MFETAELGQRVDKGEFEAQTPVLRTELLSLQARLRDADFPLIVLISGVDGAGKGETVNLLHEWMDARYLATHALGPRTDEERDRPSFWRFWMALPPRGRTGVFFGSWYTEPLLHSVLGDGDNATLDVAMRRVIRFERALVADGALLIKFWLHLSKKQQKKRFKKLEADPKTRWRVTDRDWSHYRVYDRYCEVATRMIRQTSTGEAPWTVVEGNDHYFRSLTVGRCLADRLRERLEAGSPRANGHAAAVPAAEQTVLRSSVPGAASVLDAVDLGAQLEKKDYEHALEKWQARLGMASRKARERKVGAIALFEGWDASGKGGAIRRITQALDARYYHVIPIAAPTDEELARHYLWRFWRHLPRLGHLTVYDRSWYGRVLVERVEGFASPHEWLRAYAEINDFEEQLVEHGIVLCKFWLHISPAEQLRRFREREEKPWKRYKITPDDWRNRDKWDAYEEAASEMIGRTSTEYAPWAIVPAEDKRWARVKTLKTLTRRLEAAIEAAR